MEWFDTLAGLLVGFIAGASGAGIAVRRFERRGYLPASMLAPAPEPAPDHQHIWHERPYLHDPSLPAWLYACKVGRCRKVLRSNKELV